MGLRLIHSADWHLGQTLHGHDRSGEHSRFLDWLAGLLEEVQADALLVAGDVFDSPNPPVSAQRALFHFLMEARRRQPGLQVVMVAGNHDGAARLEAPAPLLAELGVQMVGTVPRDSRGQIDPESLVLPIRDRRGAVAAWCAAIPFLRPSDLPPRPTAEDDEGDAIVTALAAFHDAVFAAARQRRQPGQALVAMGHAALAGGLLSELSERRILCGGLHALPATLFPQDLAYVALGHLHRAQAVEKRDTVRYSGSPLPLALSEDRYDHQVVQVDLAEGALAGWTAIAVPRTVDILRLPGGPTSCRLRPDAISKALETLPARSKDPAAVPPDRWPFLEVRVALDAPRPGLVAEVSDLLQDRAVRLARLDVRLDGAGEPLPEAAGAVALSDLGPEAVFQRCWETRYGQEPAAPIRTLFQTLLSEAASSPSPTS